jgi:hypothetical protein
MKNVESMIGLVGVRLETPRSVFAVNEVSIISSDTIPPARRGERFQTLIQTSFLASKARGVSNRPASQRKCHERR